MKKIKILLILFLLSSCTTKELEVKLLYEIRLNQIFDIEDNKYFVLFYSQTCPACQMTLEVMKKKYEKEKYVGFFVNLDNEEVKYSLEKEENINKSNVQEIKFYSVPYLIYIENKKVVKEIYGYAQIQKENLYIFFEEI